MDPYTIDHNSGPVTGPGGTVVGSPPPPPVQPVAQSTPSEQHYPTTSTVPHTGKAPAIDIEAAISRDISEYVEESKSFSTSLLLGLKRYLVPFGTIMDILSASLRFLTLGFLLVLPDLYQALFYPAKNDTKAIIAHYVILIISIIGIAVGVPVALFSSVYSLVTLTQKREAALQTKVRKIRNERQKFYNQKVRGAWRYICVAFLCAVAVSIPYFLNSNKDVSATTKTILAEAVFIIVPFIASIVTLITERESNADPQERSTRVGANLGLYNIFRAGMRLAEGAGTFRDAAAVLGAMNGDISASIEAGVAEQPDTRYLTLGEIAERLGRSPAKDDPFRRTLNNVVAAAARRGDFDIRKHPKKGYLVPETAFVPLFEKYLYNKPATPGNISNLRVVKNVTQEQRDNRGLVVRIWQGLFGAPPTKKTVTTQTPDDKQQAS